GINNGANVGYDINYSGTLGAAREAFSYGIPTMAVSFFTHNPEADFSVPCHWTVKVLEKLKDKCSADCLYNLNVPNKTSSEIRGLKICPMSQVKYFSGIEENIDPYGRKYYFITGNYNWKLGDRKDADFLLKNYVTLTPIKIDYSDYDEINRLNNIFFTEKEEN
ncbi:MAG: hypothetical protein KBT47_09300, partial [Armatimonadetes bacterium]|nr:hypothetical protein [Candidatus Hippobium faecium]